MCANGTASDVRFCRFCCRFRESKGTVAKGWLGILLMLQNSCTCWYGKMSNLSFGFMMFPCSYKWCFFFRISLHHQQDQQVAKSGSHLFSLGRQAAPTSQLRPLLPQRGAFDWSHFGREATERCPLWIPEICKSGAGGVGEKGPRVCLEHQTKFSAESKLEEGKLFFFLKNIIEELGWWDGRMAFF